jgi:tocopherol O-methyltransferase
MYSCPSVEKSVIRNHYNLTTPFYRLFWGPHIHHGLWESNETPREAQLRLTERLATIAGIDAGDQMVDVGCGMGASSIHLARTRDCSSLGITISSLQRRWADMSARWHGVSERVEFRCMDAETIVLPAESRDIVWSVECTEHLFDKRRFFEKAASWLKPGGAMAICAWLAADMTDAPKKQQLHDVCEGFFCPSLGTMDDYASWMEQASLKVECCLDWTESVRRTWQICDKRVHRSRVRWLAPLFGNNSTMFLDRFKTILDAYDSGAMQYGCFVARKPQ